MYCMSGDKANFFSPDFFHFILIYFKSTSTNETVNQIMRENMYISVHVLHPNINFWHQA